MVAKSPLKSIRRARRRLPLLGHALSLWRDPLGFLKSLRETGDLVRVDVGTLPVYFVNSAALTHEVLVTQSRHFEKGRLYDRTRPLVGNGLATAGGDLHRRHRRLMQPMFHTARIERYAEIMSSQARIMTDSWEEGTSIDVDKALFDFSVGTLAECMFSAEFSRPAAEAVRRDIPVLFKNMLIRAVSPKFLDPVPIAPNRRYDAASVRLRGVMDSVIAQGRRESNSEDVDLLSTLLAARDADTGETLSDEEIRDELVTMAFAGMETTASMLAWTFHELAKSPEVESRLTEEIDSVLGTRSVTFQDVAKLHYTRRVLNEVCRLHSVPLLMRRTIAPVSLDGVQIPKGTEIGFSLYALHRDSRLYPEPERFDPDRWLSENAAELPREAFIPFGAGNRKCIGDAFAWAEMVIALATVASRWRLRPTSGHTVREVAAAVAHPDRLPMTPVLRTAEPASTASVGA